MIYALMAGKDKRVFSEIETILVDNKIFIQWCDSGNAVLSNKKFHEVYEGLGVLMQFPVVPGKKHAQKLWDNILSQDEFKTPVANILQHL